MKQLLKDEILHQLAEMDGKVGFYFKNLETGEAFGYNEEQQFLAASVVKLPFLAALMLLREQGKADFSEAITICKEQMRPASCGVVAFMTGDENGSVTLDINTLYHFMMIISDTTATNALYHHYGNDTVISSFRELGLKGTQFNREYYDAVRESQGIQNYFVPQEIGMLLEKMYQRTLVSPSASREMEQVLLHQQINHKMGGKLPAGFPIAHKTGEEPDQTHDVGIVYGKEPFIVCFASNQTNISAFEDFIRRTTLEIAKDIDPELRSYEKLEAY